LLFKTFLATDDSGVFRVKANGFEGFQYGDPGKHPSKVTVVLYSADGLIELNFFQSKSSLAISQADINRAIQTVRYTGLDETAQK